MSTELGALLTLRCTGCRTWDTANAGRVKLGSSELEQHLGPDWSLSTTRSQRMHLGRTTWVPTDAPVALGGSSGHWHAGVEAGFERCH
jgi:hypothetical protein